MKDEIMIYVKEASYFEDLKKIIDNYMNYYNKDRYQYELAKLSPDEYLEYYKTGIYPLKDLIKEDEKTLKKFLMIKTRISQGSDQLAS